MRAFIKTYWFFIGIAIVVAAAFQYPTIGVRMKQWHILRGGIFLAFLIAGLTLETRSILDQVRNVKPIVVSLISSLVLFPLLALLVGRICFPSNADFFVGLFILAVAPVTIASGTIMTAMAGGNVPLSLFICVVGNFCAIFTVPVTLNLLLQIGQTVTLPTGRMIQGLVLTVLVPILIGQVLRIRLKDAIQSWNKAFAIFAQCLVLLIICYAVASSTAKMATAGFQIIYVLVIMTLLHVGVLGLNYGLSKLARFDAPLYRGLHHPHLAENIDHFISGMGRLFCVHLPHGADPLDRIPPGSNGPGHGGRPPVQAAPRLALTLTFLSCSHPLGPQMLSMLRPPTPE